MPTPKNKRLLWQLPFLTLLVMGTILIIRQQHATPYQHCRGLIFGTTYSITYQYADDLQQELVAAMQQVDSSLSMFNEQSVISKVNQNKPVDLNDMFVDVFQLAQTVSKDTDGAFDITVAPLVNAWGFGFKYGQMPDQHAVDSLLAITGYQKVRYDGKRIVKQDSRMMLDCSAIAKGYGVDAVARTLRDKGVKNYMVEIGGEVVTSGVSGKRLPWRIGVTKPTLDTTSVASELQTVLNITDKAMATSGNYRNYYYKGGKRYAHTIDPKTGRPVQHNLLSATVLCDRCAVADAYATAFMVMGFAKAQQLLARHPELMAYLIYDDHGQNKVWYSPSLKDKIHE
ncbi:MAG: FAD:protein FMN transferase [Prevotella sp.]|nr:FAD:protein FMN transferase [Prevotella sp.]